MPAAGDSPGAESSVVVKPAKQEPSEAHEELTQMAEESTEQPQVTQVSQGRSQSWDVDGT